MRRLGLVIILLIIILSACNKKHRFRRTPDGIQYYFVERHSHGPKPFVGGGAVIDVRVYWQDSLMFDSRDLPEKFTVVINDTMPGSIDRALMMMHQGDSAVFKLNAIKFLTHKVNMQIPVGMTAQDSMMFYIRLRQVLSPEEVEEMHQKYLDYRRKLEPQLIDDYIKRHPDYHFELQPSGLYIARVKDGHGLRPLPGDSVYVNYIAYFINGEPFSSTLKKRQVFRFKIGDGKVIPGLEMAIRQMREGQVVFVIIPSYLAYGEEGLLDLIPPYSPLVFQVELKQVKPAQRVLH